MTNVRRAQFRPCIDLHDGRVKQIVGGTLESGGLETNFVAAESPAHFAKLYAADDLRDPDCCSLGCKGDNLRGHRLSLCFLRQKDSAILLILT